MATKKQGFEYAPAPESRGIVDIKPSYGLFVNGEFVDGHGRSFKTISPSTEEVLAEVAEANEADVDLAAFDDSEPDPLPLILRSSVEREARRFGDALGLAVDWDAVGRLDDEMLVNAIAQVAPFDVGAKQALLEESTLAGRADLVVQLMQFQRLAPGGADVGQTLQ